MLAADSEESDWLIDIIAIGDAVFHHAALCYAANTSLLVLGDSGNANVDSIRFTVVTSVGHLLIRRCILKCTCRITRTYLISISLTFN